MLGAEGWSDDYDKPLGDPLGPAKYVGGAPATLTRTFRTGTKVVFTYDKEGGKVCNCITIARTHDPLASLITD